MKVAWQLAIIFFSALSVSTICWGVVAAHDSKGLNDYAYYPALDADQAADFCRDVIGMKDITSVQVHTEGERMLSFGMQGKIIHFETVKSTEKRQQLNDFIESLDRDLDDLNDWTNTQVGMWLNDLSPLVSRLQSYRTPFVGPVLRADGLYQLYVRVNGVGFLEFDSMVLSAPEHESLVKNWYELWAAQKHSTNTQDIYKTKAYGETKIGIDFSTVDEGWSPDAKITQIDVNWGTYLHSIELHYNSNFSAVYGAPVGEHLGRMVLEKGEFITNGILCLKKISMGLPKKVQVVSFVKFFTNTGRQEFFGESSDDCFYLLHRDGFEVVGFHGKESYRIDSLGFSFMPITKK